MSKPKRFSGLCICTVIMIVLLAAGCATVGKDFPSTAAAHIVINKTTQTEVLSMLGEPWRTGLEDGLRTWTYGYYKYRLFGPTDTKDLVITFNADNTVNAYTFNTTE